MVLSIFYNVMLKILVDVIFGCNLDSNQVLVMQSFMHKFRELIVNILLVNYHSIYNYHMVSRGEVQMKITSSLICLHRQRSKVEDHKVITSFLLIFYDKKTIINFFLSFMTLIFNITKRDKLIFWERKRRLWRPHSKMSGC